MTTYTQNMRKHNNAPQNETQQRSQTQDRGSNFQLGQQGSNFLSEAQSQFKNPGRQQINEIDPNVKKDLRSSHFKFNETKNNQFKTTTMLDYGSKIEASRNFNDPGDHLKVKNSLRQSHFTLGNEKTNYTTVKEATYKNLAAERQFLDPNQESNLRKHHFNLGTGESDYRSVYKKEYKWA
eukprot:TRINITY_DN6580_c0_g1_i1.p2 TRINITY_DN6580_c0_g1~~TRINITY_DN6580_c0_g1_i1.p2  ORF type:complete len:180 (+),score=15.70 TRINITY_DN6580_c0_g1_i1:260-799(+)